MPKIPTCPACKKTFKTSKSMKRHLANLHPTYSGEIEPGGQPAASPASPAVLEIKEPPRKEKKEKKETVFEGTRGYHCIDCGKDVAKGQSHCPHCGTELDWSQVE